MGVVCERQRVAERSEDVAEEERGGERSAGELGLSC